MQFTSPAERRITVRMLSYWERLRGDRPMPAEENIDPDDLDDLWDCCFLIHVKDLDKPDYNYTYLGDDIAHMLNEGILEEEEVYEKTTKISELTKNYRKVVETRKPVLEEGEFLNIAGTTVKFRQCLLPLGEGDNVVAILGAVRFKLFS